MYSRNLFLIRAEFPLFPALEKKICCLKFCFKIKFCYFITYKVNLFFALLDIITVMINISLEITETLHQQKLNSVNLYKCHYN